MKFQKLSENKLKIIIASDELPDYSNFDDFISDSNEARNSFLDILEKACSEVGFITKNYKIKIDAAVLNNGNVVFTITKLVKLKKAKVAVTPRRVPKNDDMQSSDIVIYKFDHFDDFYNFCSYLKKLDMHNLRTFAKSVELYCYNDNYYLYISHINENHNEKGRFYSSITEFSKFFSSREVFIHVLKEKGTLVLKNNAITTYMKKI